MFDYPYYNRRPFPNVHRNPYNEAKQNNIHANNQVKQNNTHVNNEAKQNNAYINNEAKKDDAHMNNETSNRNIFSIFMNGKKPNDQDCIFELFGLKLYSDDILILALLFLLYTENIKDDYLFIILVLLLLS